ncbi:hypothetical protein TKK_0017283 [Trichogramma kaykai]
MLSFSLNYGDLCFIIKDKLRDKKVAELSKFVTTEEVIGAAKKKLKVDNNTAGLKLIDLIFNKDTAEKLLKLFEKPDSSSMSAEEGLSYLIETHMSRDKYQLTRNVALEKGHDLFPSYKKIYQSKKATYPNEIFISERLCRVSLQSLLNHTAQRLMMAFDLNIPGENRQLKLISKYEFDGTNAKCYKQKSDDSGAFCDNVFCTSLLPLRLVDADENIVYWSNPTSSSTQFCRPIKLSFEKETADLARTEESQLKEEIERLTALEHDNCSICFETHLTMIVGKTSTATCHVCKSTISQFNNIYDMYCKPIIPESLKYGISILHAHIRFMEMVLHISYRMTDEKEGNWQLLSNNPEMCAKADERKNIFKGHYVTLCLLSSIPQFTVRVILMTEILLENFSQIQTSYLKSQALIWNF